MCSIDIAEVTGWNSVLAWIVDFAGYQVLNWFLEESNIFIIRASIILLEVGQPKKITLVTDMYTSSVHAHNSLLTSVIKTRMSGSILRVSDLK